MFPINNNMMAQFQQFYRMIQGKDPKVLLQELISSGKVTSDQVEQAKKMAEQFKGFLK